MNLKDLWKKQWFKNLVFFIGLGVLFFTGVPEWINIQVTKFGLESPQGLSEASPKSESMHRYNIGLQQPGGDRLALNTFQGKYVFVNLWASWCVPCLAEFSSMADLQAKLPEMEFVFLNLEEEEAFQKYLDRTRHELPFYRLTTPMPKEMTAEAIPATYILDPEGRIIFSHFGASDWSDGMVVHQLMKLMGQSES